MRHALHAHPDTPPASVTAVAVEVYLTEDGKVLLSFQVEGSHALVLPPLRSPARTNDLWRTTCFEFFVRTSGSTSYSEFNFSPTREWAAYAFDDYRAGMRELPLSFDPDVEDEGYHPDMPPYICDAEIVRNDLPDQPLLLGLAAVIEEQGGTISYWALAHPPGPPDFHHPDCFVLELPSPERT